MLWKENKPGKEADVGSNPDSAPSQLCDSNYFLAAVLTSVPLSKMQPLTGMLWRQKVIYPVSLVYCICLIKQR